MIFREQLPVIIEKLSPIDEQLKLSGVYSCILDFLKFSEKHKLNKRLKTFLSIKKGAACFQILNWS
jgi:hypothetical protein